MDGTEEKKGRARQCALILLKVGGGKRARERRRARQVGRKAAAAAGETAKGRIESVPVVSQYLHLMSRLVKT